MKRITKQQLYKAIVGRHHDNPILRELERKRDAEIVRPVTVSDGLQADTTPDGHTQSTETHK